MPNPIPADQAVAVAQRERFSCLRCGGRGCDRHHRRRRNVADEHQHCLCNLVLLCRTCHRWVHANPVAAKDLEGFVVSAFESNPGTVPVFTFRGWALLRCDGTIERRRNVIEDQGRTRR